MRAEIRRGIRVVGHASAEVWRDPSHSPQDICVLTTVVEPLEDTPLWYFEMPNSSLPLEPSQAGEEAQSLQQIQEVRAAHQAVAKLEEHLGQYDADMFLVPVGLEVVGNIPNSGQRHLFQPSSCFQKDLASFRFSIIHLDFSWKCLAQRLFKPSKSRFVRLSMQQGRNPVAC